MSAMLERGEVHVGIRHDQYVNRYFASHALPPDEILAACEPSLELGHAGMIDIGRLAVLSVAAAGIGLLTAQDVQRGLPSRTRRAQHSAREPRAAHLACARRGRARGSDHSVAPANGSLRAENRPRNASAQTASGAIGHSVGQTAPTPALCRKLLRGARRVYARGAPDHAAVGRQDGGHTEASCCPRTSQAHRPRLKGRLWVIATDWCAPKIAPCPQCPES